VASAGFVEGYVDPCPPAPGAPTGLVALPGNRVATVHFTPTGTDADFWEYSVDGRSWETATDVDNAWPGSAEQELEVPSLNNGYEQRIRIRGVHSTAGAGTPSAEVTVTPVAPISAPTDVVVKAGPSSVTITWSEPALPGTLDTAGYVVGYGVEDAAGQGGRGGLACKTSVDERRCTIPAETGGVYTLSVAALDEAGNEGVWSERVSTPPVPAASIPGSVPASDGELQRPAGQTGSVRPGATLELSGSGYLPGSTVTVLVYSAPQVLAEAVADAHGAFTVTAGLPEDLATGSHTLVASGVDDAGELRYLTLPITVARDDAAVLASTGADIALPLGAGVGALVLGSALLAVSRRRTG